MSNVGKNVSENVLRCYGHIRRMDGNRLVKRIYKSGCSDRRVEDREVVGWIICVTALEKEADRTHEIVV